MERPVEQFDVIGEIPEGAIAALARMLLDVAERELIDALESSARPSQNERAAGELTTTRRR